MQRMREILRSSLGRSLRDLTPEDRLTAAWQVVCGAALAARGEVSHLDAEGVLHVRVHAREWMNEFMDRRSTLAAELSRIAAVPLRGIHFEQAKSARARPAGKRQTPSDSR